MEGRPIPQVSAYHKAQVNQFESSFASTIDGHHNEAAMSEAEKNPYEESATDYSEASASEMDNSSHHMTMNIREKTRAPLSQRKRNEVSNGYEKDAEMASFLSPVKVKQGQGRHFESPHMAALAFDEEAALESREVEGVYDDDEIPDHTTHQHERAEESPMHPGGGREREVDRQYETLWSPGGTQRKSHLGRNKATGIGAIFSDFAKDCASYLRDIECEELIPDCRPKTWYRLVCSAKGRGSICRPVLIMVQAFGFFASDSRSWRSGMPLILLGLAVAMAVETLSGPHSSAPHYNTAVMLVLMVGVGFDSWPTRRMAPQIIISLITGLSAVLDVITIALSPAPPPAWVRIMTAFVTIAKIVALYSFLMQAQGTLRARRYLWRRLRLFLVPLNEPRRLMKDVRGRMLALGWLHLVCALLYLGFFIASVTTFGYQVVMSSGQAAVSLSMFLLFKSITTTALVVGLALDTDPVLCLAYFGCLGFNMRFVKDYTRNKRAELGGWPYPFFFNATRFTLFEAAKAVDFVWGVVGWSTLSVSFGAVYGNLEASLRFVITMIYVTLFLSDVWGSLLVYSVHWLVRRHSVLNEHDALSDSDDSELDDLGIRNEGDRTPLTAEARRETRRRRRKEYRRSLTELYGFRDRGRTGTGGGSGWRSSEEEEEEEGDSDGDMYGAYSGSEDDQQDAKTARTLQGRGRNEDPQAAGGGGGGGGEDDDVVGSSPWLRRRGGDVVKGTSSREQLLRGGGDIDERDPGPWGGRRRRHHANPHGHAAGGGSDSDSDSGAGGGRGGGGALRR